jgi:hypothetical protein
METEHARKGCLKLNANYLLDSVDERGQRYTALHMGKSLGEQLWDCLDAAFDELSAVNDYLKVDGVSGERLAHLLSEQTELKGACRAFAITLQLAQSNYYADVKSVTREAMKRRAIRLGQREFEPTPGYQYNPPPVGSKAYAEAQKRMSGDGPKKARSTADKRKASTGPAKAEKSFTQEQINGIINARDTKMFTVEQLAQTFKVSPDYIRSL